MTGISASTQYTISATIKYEDGGPPSVNCFYVRQYNNGSQITEGGKFSTSFEIDLGGGWKRAYRTFTTTSTTSSILLQGYEYSTGRIIYLQDVQFELGNVLSPYAGVSGSRSDTASLIDLDKTTNLDVSGISFDSTGQPTFDGTDDKIDLGNLAAVRLGKDFTIEAVVRPAQDKWMYFFDKGYGSNNALAWGRHSSGDNWFFATMVGGSYQYVYMGTAVLNEYCHLVATYDGVNIRLYENGDQKTTTSATHDMMTSGNGLKIGGSSRMWNGDIPVTKVYSKVLTTEEVVQNFNAYKNRFNI